ncbi:hypothetical protein [Gottfriedia solisilvae]|uniref:Uncharacterized protein n=1 Tax=Gottfriedia solisilvae TaxID=1516104 RepID=A0A8J3EZ34_9BACI|nr:hypothetical protein [Gottfriedia solisilvae]GGI13996.1 hypothetical protein GCM10007380_20730 [Gottfriedia solisilvae]
MLTYEQKLEIIESFPELTKKPVSLGRTNFQYEESVTEKKNVVFHLHPNGNGFVYAEGIKGYRTNDKGMVNIRDFSEDELRTIITKSIDKLSFEPNFEEDEEEVEELWVNTSGQTLKLVSEMDMWNVYAGENLDGTFNSYGEAAEYLDEEGFSFKE